MLMYKRCTEEARSTSEYGDKEFSHNFYILLANANFTGFYGKIISMDSFSLKSTRVIINFGPCVISLE